MFIGLDKQIQLRDTTLSAFRFGRIDPTTVWDGTSFWRATLTPNGPGTIHIADPTANPVVRVFGPGGAWLSERASDMLGTFDTFEVLEPHHDVVRRAQQMFGALRLGRTETPYHELLPAVLGQRVTAGEAVRQWRTIVTRHGLRAPGPRDDLMTPPPPEVLATVPYTTLHQYGIEKKRADTLRNVARMAHHLVCDWPRTHDAATHTSRLLQIAGVGPWTSAVAGSIAFGDPDALAVGDFHLKNTVAWALHKQPRGTDEEMLASLAVYRGQRHRVVRWLQLMGFRAPARGPRRPNISITQL